jgi:predicted O-methyltransferase YrrM
MRNTKHLTPAYIVNRIREKWYRQNHPGEPWLTPAAVQFLKDYLKPWDQGLEFGSGGSTIWLARRVKLLTSVEHDVGWFQKVKQLLSEQNITNVSYIHTEVILNGAQRKSLEYTSPAKLMQDESLDFALVDGRFRDECVNVVLPKLKKGAILILDNADVYLPSDCVTPNARSLTQGPISNEWAVFLDRVKDWRSFWTCNGISATAIYFKPY